MPAVPSQSDSSTPECAAPPVRDGLGSAFARTALVVGIFLVAYFALEIAGYTQKSATFDEPLHLTAGYHALRNGDHRVDPTHPPLVRMWAALPLAVMRDVSASTEPMERIGPRKWLGGSFNYAHDFLYAGHDADKLLYAARFMIVVLGALLGVLVYCWAREWLGFWPAAGVLGFYLIEPNLSAHTALVTTDAGLTLFYFGAIYFLWRTCRNYTAFNLAGLALFFSGAIVTKFSAVVLGPMVGLLLGVALLDGRTTLTLRRALCIGGLLAATTYAAIWAVYGFRYAPGASPEWIYRSRELVPLNLHFSFVNHVLNWIDAHRLLPNAFTQGFIVSFATVSPQAGYLGGEINAGGWWYYFPVAFLIKTPLGLFALMCAGAVFAGLRRLQLGTTTLLFMALPPAVYFAVAMTSAINIGLRHVLPVYPFVLLFAALGVREVAALRWKWKWAAIALPVIVWVVTFANVYPHTLTFFNRLVGGPSRGLNYLADSNLDWGQHLKLVKAWMDEHEVPHLNLAYFGMADPGYYGIPHTYLPGSPLGVQFGPPPQLPGYVAIGATILSGVYLRPEWRTYYRGFSDLKPVAVLGNSVAIYQVETWPGVGRADGATPTELEIHQLGQVADALFTRKKWYAQAALYYEEYLKHRPLNTRAALRLGFCLLETQRAPEALLWFDRVVERRPDNGILRRQIAAQLLNHGAYAAAAAYAGEARRLLPQSARARILHELTLAALRDPSRAEKFIEDEPEEAKATDEEAHDSLRGRGGSE